MSLLESQIEAQNLLHLRPVFLHCKTTGPFDFSEVVEIAILDSAGTTLVDDLVRPKRHIRSVATQEHGITDEKVKFAPKWSEILPKVEEALTGKKICVYDRAIELRALKNSQLNDHHRWILDDDDFISLKELFSRYKNERDPRTGALLAYSLEEAAQWLGIEIEVIAYRRAREDTWLMRAMLFAIAGWKVYY